MTTTEDVGAHHVREAREAIDADMATLPTVDELAGPIVSTIYRLHRLQDLAWNLEFLDDPTEHEARFVALIETVASLVESAVIGCVPGTAGDERPERLGREARLIVFAASGSIDVCQQHHYRRAHDLATAAVTS